MTVSIHAPVKGATVSAVILPVPSLVSIHAPVKGATPSIRGLSTRLTCFNSRTRKGCDGNWSL